MEQWSLHNNLLALRRVHSCTVDCAAFEMVVQIKRQILKFETMFLLTFHSIQKIVSCFYRVGCRCLTCLVNVQFSYVGLNYL